MQKVLLLQGPVESVGINPVTQYLHRDPESRKQVWAPYRCEQNIATQAVAFEQLGFKVIYSGWKEDEGWLMANRHLFESVIISQQDTLMSQSDFMGRKIQNNKQKLYYSTLCGLREVRRIFSDEVVVFKSRSDLAVNPMLADRECAKIPAANRTFLLEYFDSGNFLFSPDFVHVAEVGVFERLYAKLYENCSAGRDYHISSHVDIILNLIELVQEGWVSGIWSMGQELYRSAVWRGIPRYLEPLFDGGKCGLMLHDVNLVIPEGFNLASVLQRIPPELSPVRPQEKAA